MDKKMDDYISQEENDQPSQNIPTGQRSRVRRWRQRRTERTLAFMFLGFLAVFCLINLFTKDRTYSESENRVLAKKPEFSLTTLASGQFMTDMESYVADQFFLRDQWISLKLLEDMSIGKKEINGVYIGKKDHLMEILDTPDQTSLDENLAAIRDFAGRHSDLNPVMTLVPNSAYILTQYVPTNAPVRDQAADIAYVQEAVGDSLNYVDLTETMSSHKEEEIYYKTDHHWTSLGARYAFEALQEPLGIDASGQDYTVYPVTHTFSGTLASKSGYDKAYDTIDIYIPKNGNTEYVVNYVEQQTKSASVYVSSALEQKDQYEVFFGGNYSRIDISTPSSDNTKNLLVFKDSYANCFVPFLIPYYRNIIMVDARYYYDEIDSLIQEEEITDILFLYNVNTFMTDSSLADVLAVSEDTGTDIPAPSVEAETAGTGAEPAADAPVDSAEETPTDSGEEAPADSGEEAPADSAEEGQTGTDTETETSSETNTEPAADTSPETNPETAAGTDAPADTAADTGAGTTAGTDTADAASQSAP